jgi:hypothetical protein
MFAYSRHQLEIVNQGNNKIRNHMKKYEKIALTSQEN